MGQHVVSRGASVVVGDDFLSTGETMCAILQLLDAVGVRAEDVTIMVVAELETLRRNGFGAAKIQSLLVFGGA